MSVIVIATGLAGFGTSAVMLAAGVSSMALRYFVSVACAYVVFLILVRLWAAYQRGRVDADGDPTDLIPDLAPADAAPEASVGGGGEFGGAGAGGRWEPAPNTIRVSGAESIGLEPAVTTEAVPSESDFSIDVPDLDDLGVLLVVPALLLGGILAALYVVYAAPVLLAEVLVDVLLVSGLYRRLKNIESRSWLATAVRRTWIPVAVVAALLTSAGFIMQRVVPHADSIGDILALF